MLSIHIDGTDDFARALERIAGRGETDHARVEPVVREILQAVASEGDRAVLQYTERFDKRRPDPLVRRDFPREEALAKMRLALDTFIVQGVQTTIPFLRRVMDDPHFVEGKFHTKFLEREGAHLMKG